LLLRLSLSPHEVRHGPTYKNRSSEREVKRDKCLPKFTSV
jgi:hypothetical protein